MSWASELPPEITARTLGLVVLTGLDVVYNAIHKAIWDSFCNNRRPDRMPLQLKLLGADHEYPKCRPKRTSYDWYVPKGILRTSWMLKHLEEIPSLVVIFFDLDWDEPLWKERQMECATRLEIVRNSLQGRNCKVAVILVQKNAPLPPGEDVLATERAASLCTLCDLSAKSLFVLPITDHLVGYTIRLENAFYELSQAYYHAACRRVKSHKDTLNKTTHQLLFVRHQFKIAFFSELKQDPQTALKHYKQAYTHITELRMHNTNILEVKTIAGFITYKICRLSFQLAVPLDSIAQFRRHIDFFKKQIGTPELSFEHYAWMAKQFQIFGDLFDEAIKLGLTAIQTQHPGFYYQQAANQTIYRQQLCQLWCKPNVACPLPDLLDSVWSLEYYGQRPWRQGVQSIEPPDLIKEREGILSLQVVESKIDHSSIIIPMLTSAISQFKRYKSPRMKRYLMVQLAEEYQKAGDFAKALTLFARVTWDYRQEKWWPLLTSILSQSLRCARVVGNTLEYVRVCVELLNKHILLSAAEKNKVQQNLLRVVKNEVPISDIELDLSASNDPWIENASKDTAGFLLEMQNLVSFIECKASFSCITYTAEVPLTVTVYLRINSPEPMQFSRLLVSLSNPAYNSQCELVDNTPFNATKDEFIETETASNLYFVPETFKKFTFSFPALAEDVGKQLEISSVTLELGKESPSRVILCWTMAGGEGLILPSKSAQQKCNFLCNDKWNDIDEIRNTKVEPREAQTAINLQHDSPALYGEFYKINVSLLSEEEQRVNNVRVTFAIDSAPEPSSYLYMERPVSEEHSEVRSGHWDISSLDPKQEEHRLIYVKNMHTESFQLTVKVHYSIELSSGAHHLKCRCHREMIVTVPIVSPYALSFRLLSLQAERLEAIHAEEPFLLLVDVKCSSPWQLEFESSCLDLSPLVSVVGNGEINSHLANVTLAADGSASECFLLVSQQSSDVLVSLGEYSVSWKRHSAGDNNACVSTNHQLPSVAIEHVPMLVSLDLPAFGRVRDSFIATYNIHNCTIYTQQAECILEGSEAFMFCGPKQLHFRVLPSSTYQLRYQLVPLLPGNVALPRLRLNLLRAPAVTMDAVLQKMLPTHIFVLPADQTRQL